MQWYKVEDKMPERFVSVLGCMPDQAPSLPSESVGMWAIRAGIFRR